MAELTFRDFAGNLMRGDAAAAAKVLEELLGLSAEQATAATQHFAARMKEPAFLPKAMGLRGAVQGGSDVEIAELLGDCFALDEAGRATGVATLRQRYPAPT